MAASLVLGSLSLLTSLWFTSLLQSTLDTYGALNQWAESTVGMQTSTGAALAGLILGIVGFRQAGSWKAIAVTGILLNGMGFMVEAPMLLLYFIMT
jgi:hypothetical protein